MIAFRWAVINAKLDPTVGTEQRGTRPVLIVSSEAYSQTVANVTVLPLTSTQRRLYPSEVLLARGKAGQPLDSIVMAHQIRTISKKRLGDLVGYLEDYALQTQVLTAIKEHLDIE